MFWTMYKTLNKKVCLTIIPKYSDLLLIQKNETVFIYKQTGNILIAEHSGDKKKGDI